MTDRADIYFGACDRQMEAFVDFESFREALVYDLLFQGNLVIPDIFFYISSHLAGLLLFDRQASNFIATGVREGALVPAFRKKADSFTENLDEIKRSGIQGLHEKSHEIARILDDAVTPKRLYSRIWPSTPVSVGYKRTLERALLSPNILDQFPELEEFWSHSSNLRESIMSSIPLDSLGGIRRGDMYNAVFKYFLRRKAVVDDVRNIWSEIQEIDDAVQAKRIIKWINYCYYFNQGQMFELNPALSALDQTDMPFARHLAGLNDGSKQGKIVSEEFRLPSAGALLTIDPRQLFELRDSDVGAQYFSCIADWRSKPTDDTSLALLEALDAYIASINRVYFAHGKSVFNWAWHLKAHIPCGKSTWSRVGRESLASIAIEALGEAIPHIGLASIVGQVAAATYETLPADVRDKIGPAVGVKKRAHVEIEFKVQQFSTTSNTTTTEASFMRS